MLHRLCGPPSIPLSFTLASILPRRCTYRVSYGTDPAPKSLSIIYYFFSNSRLFLFILPIIDRFITNFAAGPTPSAHRLQRGLPGYLILFAPHAFAPQRQSMARSLPSPSVFFQISTDFTPTPGIPAPPLRLQPCSSQRVSAVKLRAFTPGLQGRLHALYAQ